MGRRPARVGHFLSCFLVLQVTGLPRLLIISNTTKRVMLILGSVFPAFSSLPSLLVHSSSAGMCRASDCSSQLASPLSIPGPFFMVPFLPALTEILPPCSFVPPCGHFPRRSPCSLQTLLAASVEVASCPWWLFSQSSWHSNLSPGAEGKQLKGCCVTHHLISFVDESHYCCFGHLP